MTGTVIAYTVLLVVAFGCLLWGLLKEEGPEDEQRTGDETV